MKMIITASEWVVLLDAVISEGKRSRDRAIKLNSRLYAKRAERLMNMYERLLLSDSIVIEYDSENEE